MEDIKTFYTTTGFTSQTKSIHQKSAFISIRRHVETNFISKLKRLSHTKTTIVFHHLSTFLTHLVDAVQNNYLPVSIVIDVFNDILKETAEKFFKKIFFLLEIALSALQNHFNRPQSLQNYKKLKELFVKFSHRLYPSLHADLSAKMTILIAKLSPITDPFADKSSFNGRPLRINNLFPPNYKNNKNLFLEKFLSFQRLFNCDIDRKLNNNDSIEKVFTLMAFITETPLKEWLDGRKQSTGFQIIEKNISFNELCSLSNTNVSPILINFCPILIFIIQLSLFLRYLSKPRLPRRYKDAIKSLIKISDDYLNNLTSQEENASRAIKSVLKRDENWIDWRGQRLPKKSKNFYWNDRLEIINQSDENELISIENQIFIDKNRKKSVENRKKSTEIISNAVDKNEHYFRLWPLRKRRVGLGNLVLEEMWRTDFKNYGGGLQWKNDDFEKQFKSVKKLNRRDLEKDRLDLFLEKNKVKGVGKRIASNLSKEKEKLKDMIKDGLEEMEISGLTRFKMLRLLREDDFGEFRRIRGVLKNWIKE